MELSRRKLLAVAPLAVTVAACGVSSRRTVVNVRDFGAVGDGVTDDSPAIVAAAAALKPGCTLFFPTGTYRFAEQRPAARAAIAISGVSDVAVEFGRKAELLMDNLDGDGAGTSHGIVVRGRASGVTLRNVRIRWKNQPARRSFGDGIRIVGYPSDSAAPPPDWTGSTGCVTDVRILDCEVRSSPQAGVIMMGVARIRLNGLTVRDTLADGLHFNACRQASVHNHTAIDCGDDGLALVTYYSPASGHDNVNETFSFAELNEWTDSDFTISNISVSGGRANGLRLAGANGVHLRGITVSRKNSGAGIIADTAAPGAEADWHYVASRGVRLDRVLIEDCETGVQVIARPASAPDPRFTAFDIDVKHARIRDCSNWAVRVESLTAQPVTGFRLDRCRVEATATTGGNGGVGLQNTEGARLGTLSVSHSGAVTFFSAIDSAALQADRVTLRIDQSGASGHDAGPPAVFLKSDGRIGLLAVRWPDAPEGWQPIRISSGDGQCSRAATTPVAVSTLSIEPANVQDPISRC